MRLGVFPLCLDSAQNLDQSMYSHIMVAAKYFGLGTLARWIKEKKYEKVVTITYTREWVPGLDGTWPTSTNHIEPELVNRTERFFVCASRDKKHTKVEHCQGNWYCFPKEKPSGGDYHIRETQGTLFKAKHVSINHDLLTKHQDQGENQDQEENDSSAEDLLDV